MARAGGLALAVTLGALATIVEPAGSVDAGSADTCARGRRSLTGTLDGAAFRVELPARWNCTLVLYSHGYFPPAFDPGPGYQIGLANRPETEQWLLEHGYALAASEFRGRTGAVFEQAITDQLTLLDWYDSHIGRPRCTVALGSSGGGALSVMLAERHPRRLDGVAALCAPLDISGQLNLYLDLMFAIRTLLIPPGQQVDLVRPRDPVAGQDALMEAVGSATGSPEGRARLALANAVANIQGWNSAVQPRPDSAVEQVMTQAAIDAEVIFLWGPVSRVDLESRASGNPSWNTGVDYRQQLARSNQRHLVEQAYAAAGPDADLDADVERLAAAPRIAADPAAQAWLTRFGVPQATTPSPVITLHNTADFAVPEHERWYADRVARFGHPDRVRQLYADRATHCAFTASEEIVTLTTLFTRIQTGRWPTTDPQRLRRAARRFSDQYQLVFDFATNRDWAVSPAFTSYTPTGPLRPSP